MFTANLKSEVSGMITRDGILASFADSRAHEARVLSQEEFRSKIFKRIRSQARYHRTKARLACSKQPKRDDRTAASIFL